MDIKFNCTGCGTHLVIDAAGAGTTVPCPTCGQSLTVPPAAAFEAGKADTTPAKPEQALDFREIIQSAIVSAAREIESGILDDDRKLDYHFRKQSPLVLEASFGKANARAFLDGKISGRELLDSRHVLSPEDFARLQTQMETIGQRRKNPD